MWALAYEGHLGLSRRPLPRPTAGEVLIRVTLAGICRTDIEITRGYGEFSGILGHEFVGVVESAPVPEWVGRRVVGEINVPCGRCATCRAGDGIHCRARTVLGIVGRDGALAQYCALPLANLHPLPDEISDRQAVFVEPLAAALAIAQRHHLRPQDRVAVVGAGKLGLLVARVLVLSGCDLTVVGRHQRGLAELAGLGIQVTQDGGSLPFAAFDVVVDCSGSTSGFALARELVRPRGLLVLKSTVAAGEALNATALAVDEVTVSGSRCGPFAPALRLLARRLVEVEPLVEAVFPIADGLAAFRRAADPGALKVLVEPLGASPVDGEGKWSDGPSG
ncbi:MAG: alcohol dehydrogenase catalytic domain-containing protein [Magnetococcales bacterium]|nr:alcohol dehydrogenase catalytic domain-containing protein [Magnetococcales bacterium]